MNDLLYTVLVPAFNEQGNIGPLIRKLRQNIGSAPEVLVIDDGSVDQTYSEAAREECRVIRHQQNRGKGAAIRTGISEAKGKYVVFIDGDGQDNPAEILNIVSELEKGEVDAVIGSRFVRSSEQRYSREALQQLNEVGNRVITWMLNVLFGTQLTDSMASLKGYKAERIKSLKLVSDRYEIEAELVIRWVRAGWPIKVIPVHRYPRELCKSNLFDVPLGRFKFALRIMKTIVKGFFAWR